MVRKLVRYLQGIVLVVLVLILVLLMLSRLEQQDHMIYDKVVYTTATHDADRPEDDAGAAVQDGDTQSDDSGTEPSD